MVGSNKGLRELVFGKPNGGGYDGIHLRGEGAGRHFTYRAIQSMKSIITGKITQSAPRFSGENKNKFGKSSPAQSANYHADCPQTVFDRRKHNYNKKAAAGNGNQTRQYNRNVQSEDNSQGRRYSDVVDGRYSVPTKNRFNPLN
jgi:hypothetical protein